VNILITGIHGFIGQHLVNYLDQIAPNSTLIGVGLKETAPPVTSRMKYYQCDLTDQPKVQAILEDALPDQIYHLAGISRISQELKLPDYFASNFQTTQALIDSIKVLDLKVKFFLASSVHIYGNQSELATESLVAKPQSPYAYTKYLAEQLVKASAVENPNLRGMIARLYSCFGPGQPEGFVAADFCRKVVALPKGIKGKLIVGPLHSYRRFLDVRDLVDVLPKLMGSPSQAPCEIVNIASPHELTVKDILDKILALDDKDAEIISDSDATNRFAGLRINMDRLKAMVPDFHFRPVEETLKDMLDEHRKEISQ